MEGYKPHMSMHQCIYLSDTMGSYDKVRGIAVRIRWNRGSSLVYDDWQLKYTNEIGDIATTLRIVLDHQNQLHVGASDIFSALGVSSVQKAIDRWIPLNDMHYFRTGIDILSRLDSENIGDSKRPAAGISYPYTRAKAFITYEKALRVIERWQDGRSDTAERRRSLSDEEWEQKIDKAIDFRLWLRHIAIPTIQFSDCFNLTKDL